MVSSDELLLLDNQSTMLLLFLRTYPGTGGWSSSVFSTLSNLDLKDATDSAELTLSGSALNSDAPVDYCINVLFV